MPGGLERGLATVVVAVAAAAADALVLGWLGLGMEPIPLALVAVATWGIARIALRAPELALLDELGRAWSALGSRERALAGAVAGAALAAVAAWVLRPRLGYDTFLYHLPLAVTWVQGGDPGTVSQISVGTPVGAYPAFDELMLAWSAAVSRSLVPFSLWPVLLLAVTACGSWLGLRSLAVSRAAVALATTALVVSQQVAGWQATGGSTDPASLAWLVATGGLCAASVGTRDRPARPVLVAPALLAAALAIGTKPTAAPLALVALVAAAVVHRSALRTVARPLVLAAAAGLVVGGWWYVRNSALYGSPLWPFYGTPWGDPLPRLVVAPPTFLSNIGNTVRVVGVRYLEDFGGSLVLIGAAILAPLLDRRRLIVGGAATTALAVLAWMSTPNTGTFRLSPAPVLVDGLVSTTRYLVAGVAVAAFTLALVTRVPGPPRRVAYAVLTVAAAINVVEAFSLGQPVMPSPVLLVGGAAAGALVGLGLGAVRLPGLATRRAAAAAAAVAVFAVGLGTAALTPGQFDRVAAAQASGGLLRWFAAQPGFRDGARPITTVALRQSVLAGPRLKHQIDLAIAPRCPAFRRRAEEGWVVVWGARSFGRRRGPGNRSLRCFAGRRPVYVDALNYVFAARR